MSNLPLETKRQPWLNEITLTPPTDESTATPSSTQVRAWADTVNFPSSHKQAYDITVQVTEQELNAYIELYLPSGTMGYIWKYQHARTPARSYYICIGVFSFPWNKKKTLKSSQHAASLLNKEQMRKSEFRIAENGDFNLHKHIHFFHSNFVRSEMVSRWNSKCPHTGFDVRFPIGELKVNPELHLPLMVIIFIERATWCESSLSYSSSTYTPFPAKTRIKRNTRGSDPFCS